MKYSDLDKSQKFVEGKVSFVLHNSKYVQVTDYSGLGGPEYERIITVNKAWQESLETEPKSLLNLINFTNSAASPAVISKLKDISIMLTKFSKKTAIIGLSQLQKVFFTAFTSLGFNDLKSFESEEEALNWLTKD